MKTMKQFMKGAFAVLLSAAMLLGVVACDTKNPDPKPDPDPVVPVTGVTITIEQPETTEISEGDEVKLNVVVENATDKTYTWSVSDPTILKVENDTVSIVKLPGADRYITVTATSNEDSNASASVTFLVKATVVPGQVGELSTEMLQELANSSITVEGDLTDYYVDINASYNNTANVYNMKVMMEDGAWSGSYRYAGNDLQSAGEWITDVYRRGDDGAADSYGHSGHYVLQMYIDKNNEAVGAVVKDYMSVPSVWEAQYLFNTIGGLATDIENKFVYDAETEQYRYQVDEKSEDDLYLMTYLSYSLTPLLSDTLSALYLTIVDGKIDKLVAQTEIVYDTENAEDATAYAYTAIELSFSDIGTTKVEDPEPYETDEYTQYLATALEKMQGVTNYTYRLTDTTTYAPSFSDYDYSIESATLTGQSAPVATAVSSVRETVSAEALRYVNATTASGTVGSVGFVTEDAILIAKTIQYSATMDGLDYRTEYTGYRQFTDENGDPYYEEFAYDSEMDAFYGTRHIAGNMFDVMPSFDFSAAVFKCVNANTATGSYTFQLQSTAVTRDIAMEVSAYSYASSASASSTTALTIIVNSKGEIVSTTYPYSLVSGTYLGYCTTTYSDVGTTSIPEDQFTGYVPREIKTKWSQYEAVQYHINHSTVSPYDKADMETAFKATFGEERAKNLPSPVALMDVFGDYLSGPFHNWKTSVGENGEEDYIDYWGITTQSREYDENSKITNYLELIEDLRTSLGNEGYALDPVNSNYGTAASTRYACFTKGDASNGVQIVVENNGTKWFWIYIYPLGTWKLSK